MPRALIRFIRYARLPSRPWLHLVKRGLWRQAYRVKDLRVGDAVTDAMIYMTIEILVLLLATGYDSLPPGIARRPHFDALMDATEQIPDGGASFRVWCPATVALSRVVSAAQGQSKKGVWGCLITPAASGSRCSMG